MALIADVRGELCARFEKCVMNNFFVHLSKRKLDHSRPQNELKHLT